MDQQLALLVRYRIGCLFFGMDINTRLGTHETVFADGNMVYPNPASDVLNFTKDYPGATYKIFNSVGSLVTEGKLDGQKVDVSRLKVGNYFISVTNKEEEVVNTKFIKK